MTTTKQTAAKNLTTGDTIVLGQRARTIESIERIGTDSAPLKATFFEDDPENVVRGFNVAYFYDSTRVTVVA